VCNYPSHEMVVGWLMPWLVTMDVKGSVPSCSCPKAYKWPTCLVGIHPKPTFYIPIYLKIKLCYL